ncbi:3,4-dihydroxy-2-butanone-4-phosphate synthase [Kordiimonas sp. SCSIO 12603]|uniref:3,4-dihydroxy-2-butanone-4-phosphate synthase n=1 Tax=Kordiimonas sp. SCSIO 12603 TaxID=2829596 RepID=UPI002107D6FA|nr:3,4-dihydroxy-2-butanone-4-phosphate synthase [Kordiimonas sp. SCSIO 12603]UTW59578.1 3,4-dihydroxy-2-butanone-4-phosphate synthase [Kordiimonas sp. SCSIO 12603]
MNQTDQTIELSEFGTPVERVENAIAALKEGHGILVMDDENRENEGDFIFAAETITPEQMALLIREGSGIVCLTLPDEKLQELELPQMVTDNSSSMGTAFTVSIEAKEGVTTGVSATDRVTTIKTAIKDGCKPSELARPGHVFPLRAHTGGVLARHGHTEASVELVRMAGFKPAGVLCELTLPDGTMARLPQICAYGKAHNMPVVTIEDLIGYLEAQNSAAA